MPPPSLHNTFGGYHPLPPKLKRDEGLLAATRPAGGGPTPKKKKKKVHKKKEIGYPHKDSILWKRRASDNVVTRGGVYSAVWCIACMVVYCMGCMVAVWTVYYERR